MKTIFLSIIFIARYFPYNCPKVMAEISFNKDIRPILSNKCFFCRAFEKSRKAKLRLDLEEEAFKEKDGFAAFVRNSLEDSEAWHRITSDDPDEVMPPQNLKN